MKQLDRAGARIRLTPRRFDGHRSPQVRAIVESTLKAFTERFVQAARDGELGTAAPNALAHIATAALNTLAVRARTGAGRAALDALINDTVDVICGRAP